jgi:hypothetical protein
LVNKYMAASNAKIGSLLVAVADAMKLWQQPNTDVLIGRNQLQQMLSEVDQIAQ